MSKQAKTVQAAVILAAGLGTRMKSSTPKVLHKAFGRTLVDWVAAAARGAGTSKLVAVIGPEFTEDDIRDYLPDFETVVQKERLGTGHAVMQAIPLIEQGVDEVLVLCGDVPCLRTETLLDLVETLRNSDADAAVLTMVLDDPGTYGRMIRSEDGKDVVGIVEYKDADAATRKITEVNSGTYAFKCSSLLEKLPLLDCSNAQSEYYVTDVVKMLAEEGRRVVGVIADNPDEMIGVNTPVDLETVSGILASRQATA